jgi:hypothetical protein
LPKTRQIQLDNDIRIIYNTENATTPWREGNCMKIKDTTLMPGAGAKILIFLCVLFIFVGGVCGNLGMDWYVFCNHNSMCRNVL